MTLAEGVINWNKDGTVLSAEQKRFYETNGYLVVRNVVPQYEIERYRRRFQELCEGKNVPKTTSLMRDVSIVKSEFKNGEKAINKVQDFYDDKVLFDYCKFPIIVDIVRDLIGTPSSNLMAMATMLINKPPDTGSLTSRHPLHQDIHYFPFGPADFITCAWTAMERITRANGCLVVVPGTHKQGLRPHGYPQWEGGVNIAYYGILDFDPSMPRLHVEMEAGDTVFFHPTLVHGSGVNRTEGFRKAIATHYANDDLCRYMDIKGTTKEATSDEVVEMTKKAIRKRVGQDVEIEMEFADMWRLRGRPVIGTRSNL